MGSAGLAIVNSLLDSEDGCDIPLRERLFDTDKKRRQYCLELLEDEQFAYAQYESPKVSIQSCPFGFSYSPLALQKKNGVFGGALVVRTLAAYYSSIEGIVKVRALKDLAGAHPYGAIGLSTASVCAFSLALAVSWLISFPGSSCSFIVG